MNRDIAKYVLDLLLHGRVTRRQHHVLLVLACHHQQQRETFWPSRPKIAAELQMDESQLRRIIVELEQLGILKHVPGIGAGNRSSYIFLEFEKGDVKGDKKGDFFDPAIRNYKTFTKPLHDQEQFAVECDSQPRENKELPISSSTPQNADDDSGKLSPFDQRLKDCAEGNVPHADVDRIILAFEQSPITTGKAKLRDRETARAFLTQYLPETIEYGILLASARRANSFCTLDAAGNEKSQAKVQTLAYFSNAIEEVALDGQRLFTASYAQYLRHTLRKYHELTELKKEPQRVAG